MPNDFNPNLSTGQSIFDILFPKGFLDKINLNDDEARTLYDLWKASPAGSQTLTVQGNTNRRVIDALKTKGYVAGFGEDVELTEKGKKIIVEMVTHEPNAFEKHAKEMSYSGIKAKNAENKRPKQAFFNKQASKKKQGKTFNLRKESIRRMSEK